MRSLALLLKCAFEVDVASRDGTLVEAAIRSMEDGSARLRYGSATRDITLSQGETNRWTDNHLKH